MDSFYDVEFKDAVVGQVQVKKEGLYYRLTCRAAMCGASKYRLAVHSAGQVMDLGLCIPNDNELYMLTRIPANRFPEHNIRFVLTDKESKRAGKYVPIRADEPFAYLQRLETAYLELRGDNPGAVLQD